MNYSLKVKRLDPRATLPTLGHEGDLAYDLYAIEDFVIRFGEVTKAQTGIAASAFAHGEMQVTWRGDVMPSMDPTPMGLKVEDRSGMAAKGARTLGGVIDSCYTGEIKVLITNVNRDDDVIHVKAGERFAQLRPVSLMTGLVQEVEELSTTTRGGSGFGSTGR